MLTRTALLALAILSLSTLAARADQILGTWCAPDGGRSIKVNDGSVITPGGKSIPANVVRHHVDFVFPAGEPDAGATFSADQLNDEQIQVTIRAAGGTKGPEIWTPCKPVS